MARGHREPVAEGGGVSASQHDALDSAMGLLGIILNDPSRFREVAHVRQEHFGEPAHGRVWSAYGDLIAAGAEPDVATVTDRLRSDPLVSEIGGDAFVFNLWNKAPASHLARQYADAVLDANTRQRAGAILAEHARVIREPAGDTSARLAAARHALERLELDASSGDSAFLTAQAACGHLLDSLDEEAATGRDRGAMTGLRCFDRRLRGLRPGWLIVIGGRPSMAKSGLMRSAAWGCARLNPQSVVVIFSLEMDAREIAERALSAASYEDGDPIAYVEFGKGLPAHERQRLRELKARAPCNIVVDDRGSVSVDDIRRRVWALKARGPVAAVFIDYLQLLARPEQQGRSEALILGDVTRALKQLAREAETCVVLLSQLNRLVEGRDDKRPQLADLRDSGSIEQDANAVLFPYRESYYVERSEPRDGGSPEHSAWQTRLELVRRRMDVICAKVRGGAIGVDRQEYFAEFDFVGDPA
jgi:replicative DNA helicase